MNEFEENIYITIRNEFLQSVIDKKVDTYFTNKNELTHYYNIGKMIIDAQGGEARAKYGDGLIKKFSERLTMELGKGYSTRTLKRVRRFYLLIVKGTPMVAESVNWSHFVILMSCSDDNEINYYIEQISTYHWSKRTLQQKIKDKEYHRLSDETKNKLVSKEEKTIYDLIKNPIYVNTYNSNIGNISEKALQKYILADMSNFLKQLGNGFAFIDYEYKIMIGNKPNYIDLLLFNITYNCYVVVELKVTESRKDNLGQIMVYMNYIDKHLKRFNQDKTIGIIVCKKDDKYLIEYSSDDRIRITTYELV